MFTLRFTMRDLNGVYYTIKSFETTNEVKSYLDKEFELYQGRCMGMVDYENYLKDIKLNRNAKNQKNEPVSTGGRQFK